MSVGMRSAQNIKDPDRDIRYEKLMEIVERCSKRPILDDRSPDEILGYNDQGLFD
jgi:hypothetical protein